jgi:hypothetical protein
VPAPTTSTASRAAQTRAQIDHGRALAIVERRPLAGRGHGNDPGRARGEDVVGVALERLIVNAAVLVERRDHRHEQPLGAERRRHREECRPRPGSGRRRAVASANRSSSGRASSTAPARDGEISRGSIVANAQSRTASAASVASRELSDQEPVTEV